MHQSTWSKIRRVFAFVIVLGCIGCAAEPEKREKKDSVASVDQPPNVTQTASTGDATSSGDPTETTTPVNPDPSTEIPLPSPQTFSNQPLNPPFQPDGSSPTNLAILINKVFPATTWQFETPVPLYKASVSSNVKTVSFTGTPTPMDTGGAMIEVAFTYTNGQTESGKAYTYKHHGGYVIAFKSVGEGRLYFKVTAAGTAEMTFKDRSTPPKLYIFKRIK